MSLIVVPDAGSVPSPEDYVRDREFMATALRASGASRVFEIGSIGVPGISDVDLLACFPDDLEVGNFEALAAILERKPASFLHAPWGMCERHLASLPALFALRQLRDVATGATEAPVQSATQRRVWNIEACAAGLGVLAMRTRSTARSALCLLNGITYNLGLAGRDDIVAARGTEFGDRIAKLRRSWRGAGQFWRTAEITALWSLAPSVLTELLLGYEALVAPRGPARRGHDILLPIPGARLTYCFTRSLSTLQVLRHPLTTVVALPQGLAPLFEALAAPGCGLDSWLRPSRTGRGRGPAQGLHPALADEVHSYARTNASYLRDMLTLRAPLLLLNAGTLTHLGSRPGAGLLKRFVRAPRTLLKLVRR